MRYNFRLLLAVAVDEIFSLSVNRISRKRLHSEILKSMLTISEKVRGIKALTESTKELFRKEITLPIAVVPAKSVSRIIGCEAITNRTVERFCNKIKPVVNMLTRDEKGIVFCPEKMDDSAQNIISKAIEDLTGSKPRFDSYHVTLNYDDWPVKSCINAILPEGLEFGGFSQIGHIVHVNLRENLLDYKRIIGQILLDKIISCKTVVNKLDAIGHKYRTFELDLLAGEENYKTEVHEDKLRYKLDFSEVFFNPRLGTEHKRIVQKIGKRSIFYDCCAGIGPFVLPVLRNGVHHVIANDLNPKCVAYLRQNVELNHLSFTRLKIYNMNAALFIITALANDLAKEAKNWSSSNSESSDKTPTDAHVVMNLPGMSLEFLPYFRGCLRNKISSGSLPFPLFVHCHFFVKASDYFPDDWFFDNARKLVRQSLGVQKLDFTEVRFVRNVAGNKKMFCASFQLPDKFLFATGMQEVISDEINGDQAMDCGSVDDDDDDNGHVKEMNKCNGN